MMENELKQRCISQLLEISKALKAIKYNVISIPNVSKPLLDAEFSILIAIDLIKKDGDRYAGCTEINDVSSVKDVNPVVPTED